MAMDRFEIDDLVEGLTDELDSSELQGVMDDVGAPSWFGRAMQKIGLKKKGKRKSKAANLMKKALTGDTAPTVGYRPIGLNSGSITAGAPVLVLDAIVQKRFQLIRPVLVVSYLGAAGAAYTGSPCHITRLDIGIDNQLLGTEPLPAEMFQPDTANDVSLVGDIADNGITVSITLTTPAAVPAGETVWVSGALLGKSVG